MQADGPLGSSCLLLLAGCKAGRAVGCRPAAKRSARSPRFPRKEAPMLAGLELRPTSALFSSTRSRQVSVSSRHRPPVPRRRAPRSAGTPERRGLCKPSLQAALSAWACHTGAAPGCRDPPRARRRPGVRSSAGRDRAQGCAGTPGGARSALLRPGATLCPGRRRTRRASRRCRR